MRCSVSIVGLTFLLSTADASVVLPPLELVGDRVPRASVPWAKPGENFVVWIDTTNVTGTIHGAGLEDAAETWFNRTQPWPDVDVLILFSTRQNNQVFAFYAPFANDVQGLGLGDLYGVDTFDVSPDGTSGIVFANDYKLYLEDPTLLRLVVLQELGHKWCCFAGVGMGILGRDNGHWSYFLDTGGSPMEGNAWVWEGGDRFTTQTASIYAAGGGSGPFSPLDLYFMGLVPPTQVPSFFLIADPDVFGQRDVFMDTIHAGSPPEYLPGRNITITGTRTSIAVADIVQAYGPRTPSAWDGELKVGFVLLVRPGEDTDSTIRAKVTRLVEGAEDIWSTATGGRSRLINLTRPVLGGELADCDGGPKSCAGGLDCAGVGEKRVCAQACSGWCGEGRCCVTTDLGPRCLSPQVVACTPDKVHTTGERCDDGAPCAGGGVCFPEPAFGAAYCAGLCAEGDCPDGMGCHAATDGKSYCFWDGAPPGTTGAVCQAAEDCDARMCIEGHCTNVCDPQGAACAPGTSCEGIEGGQAVCVPMMSEGDGGCGCRVARGRAVPGLVLSLGLLMVLTRRRKLSTVST